jgi:hypothetical protein
MRLCPLWFERQQPVRGNLRAGIDRAAITGEAADETQSLRPVRGQNSRPLEPFAEARSEHDVPEKVVPRISVLA